MVVRDLLSWQEAFSKSNHTIQLSSATKGKLTSQDETKTIKI